MNPLFSAFRLALGCAVLASTVFAEPPTAKPPSLLRVAVVQMRSEPDVRANVAKIIRYLADCAARGSQIAAFPECAVSGYDRDAVHAATAEDLTWAEKEISAACRASSIGAVVGLPRRREGKIFNEAAIIDSRGTVIARYAKVYLTDAESRWPFARGETLPPVFPIGATRGTVMICHDSRFPELCSLPVLAGARVMFYISHEASLAKEAKIGPYRAQIQARAVENRIFVVHANAPANDLRTGSHGQSRIVNPDGIIVHEASMLQEEIIVADLNLADATGNNTTETLAGPFGDWWRQGVQRVPIVQ